MQQLTYLDTRKLEWREVPAPTLSDDQAAIVRPLTVATCDADCLVIHGRIKLPGPVPLGHEGEGVVLDVGDNVTRFRPGDRVIIPWKIACGQCPHCRRRQTAQCTSVAHEEAYGWGPTAPRWGGFLSDAVLVPWADHMLTKMPDDVDPLLACGVADNISDGWRAVAPGLAERPGGSVLVACVQWPGSIALYAAGIAKALGASRVVFADTDPGRLAIAAKLGVEAFDLRKEDVAALQTDSNTFAGGFDVTVDASGRPPLLHALLGATARGGVCTSVAGIMYRGNDPAIPLFDMNRKSVSFHTGWVHTHAVLEGPLELIRSGRFDPSPVTTAVVDWDDAIAPLTQPFTKLLIRRPG